MTPLLNAAVYYFIFGMLLDTSRHVADFVPFLVHRRLHLDLHGQLDHAGHPRRSPATSGSSGRCTSRAPRLPIALALQQLQQLLFSMGALVVILLFFGEFPSASLAAGGPGAAAAGGLQRRPVDGRRPPRRQATRHRPADAVPAAHLDVRVRA